MWTTALGAMSFVQKESLQTSWSNALILASLIGSMTVNALATGLIAFRIFKVFCQAKDNTTSEEKSLGFTGGRKLRSVIFIIIESGMALFAIQVARVVLVIIEYDIPLTSEYLAAYDLIVPIHEMLNVITSSLMAIVCFTDNADLARV